VHDAEYRPVLDKFPDLTSGTFSSRSNLGVVHEIQTTGRPVFARPRRLPPERLRAVKEHFAELERLGIVRRGKGQYSSPLHVVPKPDGSIRPCGDYRRLNMQTTPDRYPLPHIQDFTAKLHGKKIFSKVDLCKGYHQIPVAEKDIEKTAIITPVGMFEYLRMPFGLRNSAQTFQRFMDIVCRDLSFAFVYLDDVLVASSSPEEHRRHL